MAVWNIVCNCFIIEIDVSIARSWFDLLVNENE